METPRYWFRIREMDGSWTEWIRCTESQYASMQDSYDCETRMTP